MGKTIQITNAMPRVWGIGSNKKHPTLRLKPGATNVDAAVWEEIKKNKTVSAMVDRGELEEGDTTDVEVDALPAKPSAAIKLIEKTLDMMKLRAWTETDRPANVRTALDRQIKLIESKAGKPAAD